jgi:hypothetical protein
LIPPEAGFGPHPAKGRDECILLYISIYRGWLFLPGFGAVLLVDGMKNGFEEGSLAESGIGGWKKMAFVVAFEFEGQAKFADQIAVPQFEVKFFHTVQVNEFIESLAGGVVEDKFYPVHKGVKV